MSTPIVAGLSFYPKAWRPFSAFLKNKGLFVLLLSFFAHNTWAQTVFWSDSFDLPAGGANNNNAGLNWSGNINTPGGGANTSFLGLSNNWTINTGGACVSGNKLFIRFTGNSNTYLSDIFTDRLNATPNISTVGFSNISLGFTWRCNGVANVDYGQVGLSNDGGSTWNWLPTRYQSQSSCTNASISIPAIYENISNFRIAFRFISNATSCSTCDPPFNIDNITLTGTASACNNPVANAGTNITICPGTSTTLGGAPTASGGGGGPYTYSWSPATGLSSTTVANPIASPAVATTYTVTVTDQSNGCTATASVTVGIHESTLLLTSPSGNQQICPGGSVSITAAAGFTNYVWNTPTGTVNGITVAASQVGNYTVSANDINGCLSSSAAVNVSLFAPIALSITPSGNQSICPGGSITLQSSAGFTNHQWNGVPGDPFLVVSSAGSFTLTATDANGCTRTSNTVNVSIAAPQPLTITPAGNTNLCPGQSVQLNASAGFTNYQWSTPTGSASGASLIASTPGEYAVTATGTNGCPSASNVINVTQLAPLPLSISPATGLGICPGGSITLSATAGFTGYNWTTPSGNATGANISATAAGNYSVSATGSNGCLSVSAPVSVMQFTPQTLSTIPAGNQSICPGSSIAIQGANGFSNYQWATPAGAQAGQGITATQAGNYTLQAIDANGCTSTAAPVIVSINSVMPIEVNASGNLQFCPGDSVILTAASGFTGYAWNGDAGNNTLLVTQSGTYTVTGTNSEGCPATSSPVMVQVFPAPPALNTIPSGAHTICINEPIEVVASTGFVQYQWSNGMTGQSVSLPVGSYTVTATDANGCQASSAELSIQFSETAIIATIPPASASPVEVCAGSTLGLSAADGFSNYVWNNGMTGQSINIGQPGSYTVAATSAQGCPSQSLPIEIVSGLAPSAAFVYEQTNGFAVQFTYTGTAANTYLWNFGMGNTSTLANPVHNFPFDNLWPVTLIVSNDCGSDTLQMMVEVIKTGVAHIANASANIYPNPGKDGFWLSAKSANNSVIDLWDATGRLVISKNIAAAQEATWHNMQGLKNGLYFIHWQNGNQSAHMRWIKID